MTRQPMQLNNLVKHLRRTLILVLIITGLLLAGYTWLCLHLVYSEGERAGVLQKLSYKGWICKTWEGELMLTPIPGIIPEKFYFTIPDNAVANKVNALIGRRVALKYEQHRGIPTSCFGETQYYVSDVKEVGIP